MAPSALTEREKQATVSCEGLFETCFGIWLSLRRSCWIFFTRRVCGFKRHSYTNLWYFVWAQGGKWAVRSCAARKPAHLVLTLNIVKIWWNKTKPKHGEKMRSEKTIFPWRSVNWAGLMFFLQGKLSLFITFACDFTFLRGIRVCQVIATQYWMICWALRVWFLSTKWLSWWQRCSRFVTGEICTIAKGFSGFYPGIQVHCKVKQRFQGMHVKR